VALWDVSLHGVSFLHDGPLERGTMLALQLGAGRLGCSWVHSARVVYATAQEGKWVIGCCISPPLSAMELESL
jgi:hypothetical protein